MSVSPTYYTQIFAIKCLILFNYFQKNNGNCIREAERKKQPAIKFHNVSMYFVATLTFKRYEVR